MLYNSITVHSLLKMRSFSSIKRSLTVTKVIFTKEAQQTLGIAPQVPGLSSDVVDIPNNPVGPGAAKNTDYKNPEYFCYDKTSYFQAEIEMLKYRCPQPSKDVPYYQNAK